MHASFASRVAALSLAFDSPTGGPERLTLAEERFGARHTVAKSRKSRRDGRGVDVSVLAADVTLQERHEVIARRVESYSTLPVLLLMVALVTILGAIARPDSRRARLGLVALLAWASCAVATRALWDTSLPKVKMPTTTQSQPPATIPAYRPTPDRARTPKIDPCTRSQLNAIAYTAGLATGTEYFFVAVTNHSRRSCTIGPRLALMTRTANGTTTLASIQSQQTRGRPVNVLAPNGRGVAVVTTTWAAEQAGNPDCPDGKPHPVDSVTSTKLADGGVIALTYPFDLERCLRTIGPVTDDAALRSCERTPQPVCQPITTAKPQVG